MLIEENEPCPLPDDPVLADVARAMRDTGQWGWVVDRDWRVAYITDEQRRSFGVGLVLVPFVLGTHLFSTEMLEIAKGWRAGPTSIESWRDHLQSIAGLLMADVARNGDEGLRDIIDPRLIDLLDQPTPVERDIISRRQRASGTQTNTYVYGTTERIRDETGTIRGTSSLYKPVAGMDVLGVMAFERDMGHLERMNSVGRAQRRPAALLFGDLEGSSPLARSLSTGNYFALIRRIIRATDQCIVDAGGLVGRHVGDGVVAFFPVQSFESESRAAHACIMAARSIRAAMTDVAERTGLDPDALVVRFGLHWGSTLYMGNISTAARAEVTALGDEVNEAARIEACATGGRILASKPLIERLAEDDATDAAVSPDHVTYTQLAELASATDKARRDAPAIAVCEL